jgi:outer membrane biogenesis lipoprotein LolB
MTRKEFINKVTNSHKDFLAEFVGILRHAKMSFCLIGGLAVNAYSEPVVSLDMDVVVSRMPDLLKILRRKYKVSHYPNSIQGVQKPSSSFLRKQESRRIDSRFHGNDTFGTACINVASAGSDLRVQMQTDPRYQAFIKRALVKDVMGYRLPVARIEDVFQGKVWAASDTRRRPSKRQKDLSDIQRLIETRPGLADSLPVSLRNRLL